MSLWVNVKKKSKSELGCTNDDYWPKHIIRVGSTEITVWKNKKSLSWKNIS